jgi:hypothetical protein
MLQRLDPRQHSVSEGENAVLSAVPAGDDRQDDDERDPRMSVNGGAKAGHCGGVKVGQSQCEWSR